MSWELWLPCCARVSEHVETDVLLLMDYNRGKYEKGFGAGGLDGGAFVVFDEFAVYGLA